MTEVFDEAWWDERYASAPAIWSGAVNPNLEREVAGLTPGSALEVGSGEGADAIWLAERGWRVTALDISSVALDRARANAAAAGTDVAGRIGWRRVDLLTWDPGAEVFDLVSAQYMHLPSAQRVPVFRRLAAAVAPGGTLLVVGHHVSDLDTTVHRHADRDMFFTGADITADLPDDAWQVVTDTVTGRVRRDDQGRDVTIHDTVVRATRRT